MSKRFDICSPRPGKDDKTFWHRVGTAWEGEKGISGTFDSLPIPDKSGKVSFFLFEAKPKAQAGSAPASRGGDDSEIPF